MEVLSVHVVSFYLFDFEFATVALKSRHPSNTTTIICRFDSCDREYNKINSLMKHAQDRHREHLFDLDESSNSGITSE